MGHRPSVNHSSSGHDQPVFHITGQQTTTCRSLRGRRLLPEAERSHHLRVPRQGELCLGLSKNTWVDASGGLLRQLEYQS